MSIEKDLSRIADALERIADRMTAGNTQVAPAPVTPPPMAPPAAPVRALPTTPEQLANLGASIVSALGDDFKTPFTEFVRGQVCPFYGVRKLRDIPADKISEVAQKLIDWSNLNTKK